MSIPANPFISIQNGLQKIGQPILIALGTIGCCISISIFLGKGMRQNPCSIYLIAYNIANLLFLWFHAFPNFLSFTFRIDSSPYNLPYCRFRFYMIFLLFALYPSYLVLASIDRALLTSPKTNIRQKSTRRLAYMLIGIITAAWGLFYSHAFFKVNIQTYFPGFSFCIYDAGLYTTLMTWNSIIIDGILPPTIMTICAVITLKNIRQVRVAPVSVTTNKRMKLVHKKDSQFIILVFSEILVYSLFSSLQPIMLLYTEIMRTTRRSFYQIYVEWLLSTLAGFLVLVPPSMGFYFNLIVSSSFRVHVMTLVLSLYSFVICRHRKQNHFIENTVTRSIALGRLPQVN